MYKFTKLENLRTYHNERFIQIAYQSILGREVDADGLQHYLQLFQQNLQPADFLIMIRNSDEHKQRFFSLKRNVNQVVLENQVGDVNELFSCAAINRVANFFQTKL